MEITPIKQLKLYEIVSKQIEEQIISEGYKLGDKIPDENSLAKQFNVSRTVIREAIKTLTNKGLLVSKTGNGTFITNDTQDVLRDSLLRAASMNSKNGMEKDLIEIREILEPSIAYHAAERANDEELFVLERLIEKMDEQIESISEFIALDGEFHLKLASMTGNGLIPILFGTIVSALDKMREKIFLVPGGPERGQDHHKKILEAVRKRDGQKAHAAMLIHLQQIRHDQEVAIAAQNLKPLH